MFTFSLPLPSPGKDEATLRSEVSEAMALALGYGRDDDAAASVCASPGVELEAMAGSDSEAVALLTTVATRCKGRNANLMAIGSPFSARVGSVASMNPEFERNAPPGEMDAFIIQNPADGSDGPRVTYGSLEAAARAPLCEETVKMVKKAAGKTTIGAIMVSVIDFGRVLTKDKKGFEDVMTFTSVKFLSWLAKFAQQQGIPLVVDETRTFGLMGPGYLPCAWRMVDGFVPDFFAATVPGMSAVFRLHKENQPPKWSEWRLPESDHISHLRESLESGASALKRLHSMTKTPEAFLKPEEYLAKRKGVRAFGSIAILTGPNGDRRGEAWVIPPDLPAGEMAEAEFERALVSKMDAIEARNAAEKESKEDNDEEAARAAALAERTQGLNAIKDDNDGGADTMAVLDAEMQKMAHRGPPAAAAATAAAATAATIEEEDERDSD